MILATIALSATAMAQRSVPFRTFDIQPDVKSQSLGGTHLVSGSKNYIYANPTYFFNADKRWSVYASGQILPKFDGMTREFYGNASLGYRFSEQHALFLGGRYLRGGELEVLSDIGNETQKHIRTNQYTLDLGYAYALNDQWKGFVTASMLADNTIKANYSLFAGIGLSYSNVVALGSIDTNLEATLAAYNLGKVLNDDEAVSHRNLPSTIALGGRARTEIASMHTIGLSAQVGYVTPYPMVQAGVGLEYTYANFASVRTGFNHLEKDVNYATIGLGLDIASIVLDASYNIGLNEYTKNTIALGLSLSF